MIARPRPAVKRLLADCRLRGITLDPRGDRLGIRPAGAVDESLLARLRAHKGELLFHLSPGWREKPWRWHWRPSPWCPYGHPDGWRSIYGPHLICATCHPPPTLHAVAERLRAAPPKPS